MIERVNPHHEVELLYGNITLIRRLMNDGPSSVRVPRLNLIRALNLPGREHDGIPCRFRCVRQRLPSVAVTAGETGGIGGRESVKARMERRCVRRATSGREKAFCFEDDGADPSR